MKKSFTILILSASIYFIPGLKGTIAQTLPEFAGSLLYNPVLYYGLAGSWDQFTLLQPSVFIHNGTFYMFYTGMNGDGVASIGFATSTDGYGYEKFQGNPVLTHSSNGFDSYEVDGPNVIEDETGWIMYYGARESGWGPPPAIGRATATDLTGPWTRLPDPVLTIGSPDEWDNDFISPFQVLPVDGGGFIMFYTAGNYPTDANFQIGVATSPDGLVWTKYDDPSTTDPPYAESDPVLKVGGSNDWDGNQIWGGSVLKKAPNGYEIYYSARSNSNIWGFGYATSPDGITWTKYPDNPFYTILDDPYAMENGLTLIVRPYVVINGPTAFMYYDYGLPSVIGMATADLTGINDWRNSAYKMPITNYPNPVNSSTTFSYSLEEQGHVTLKIYDGFGHLVAEPLNDHQSKGDQQVTWNAEGLPAGIYYYRLSTANCQLPTASGKLVKY